jgi:hypothetical protein
MVSTLLVLSILLILLLIFNEFVVSVSPLSKINKTTPMKKVDSTTKTNNDNLDNEVDEQGIVWQIQRDFTAKYYRRNTVRPKGVKQSFEIEQICNFRKQFHKEGELLIRSKDTIRWWTFITNVQHDYGPRKTMDYLKKRGLDKTMDIGLYNKEQEVLAEEKKKEKKLLDEQKRAEKKAKLDLMAAKKRAAKEQQRKLSFSFLCLFTKLKFVLTISKCFATNVLCIITI